MAFGATVCFVCTFKRMLLTALKYFHRESFSSDNDDAVSLMMLKLCPKVTHCCILTSDYIETFDNSLILYKDSYLNHQNA